MTILKHFTTKLPLLSLFLFWGGALNGQNTTGEFYEIKTYKLKNKSQEERVDAFLKGALIPALHKQGIKKVGVFKPLETDTIYGKRIVVLIPYSFLEQFSRTPDLLSADEQFNLKGKEYLEAIYSNPPYDRIESIVLKAFTGNPQMGTPELTD